MRLRRLHLPDLQSPELKLKLRRTDFFQEALNEAAQVFCKLYFEVILTRAYAMFGIRSTSASKFGDPNEREGGEISALSCR